MMGPCACSGQGQVGHRFLAAPKLTTRGHSCTAKHKFCALGSGSSKPGALTHRWVHFHVVAVLWSLSHV